MTNRLDAAIICLEQDLCLECKDQRCESYRAAIRILEAAAKVDKGEAQRAIAWIDSPFPDTDLGTDQVRALLAALPAGTATPDDDGTPGEEGGQRP